MTIYMHQQKSISYLYVLCGYLCLFSSAFIDNLRGPLLPIIAKDMSISYGKASSLLSLGSIGALISSFFLIWLLSRFSERRIAIGSCVFVILSVFLSLAVSSYASLIAYALCLGASIVTLNIISNILTIKGTPLKFQARALGGLHAMYGIGSLLAPLLAARLLIYNWSWATVFLIALPIILLIISILYWKAEEKGPAPQEEGSSFRLKYIHVLLLLVFGFYVAAEVIGSSWLVPYLIETYSFSHINASDCMSMFFLLLMLTRFGCMIIDSAKYERQLIWSALLIPFFVFIIASSFSLPYLLPLMGFYGPVIPLLVARMARKFPTMWRALAAWTQVSVQITLAITHTLVGLIATEHGLPTAYLLAPTCLVLTIILFYSFECLCPPDLSFSEK